MGHSTQEQVADIICLQTHSSEHLQSSQISVKSPLNMLVGVSE